MAKVAFVLGGANCLWSDLKIALGLAHPDTMIATNNTARDWPYALEHWVTLHTEKMPEWIQHRRDKGLPDHYNYWTSNTPRTIPKEHIDLYQKVESWNGSSGLLGVQVALELGFDKVILCGVPLDRDYAHYDDDEKWQEAHKYRRGWSSRVNLLKDKVKSPSGWTRSLLGEPTSAWIRS